MVRIINFFGYYRSFMISALLLESKEEGRRESDFMQEVESKLIWTHATFSTAIMFLCFATGNLFGQGLPLNIVERVPLFL